MDVEIVIVNTGERTTIAPGTSVEELAKDYVQKRP